MSYKPLVPHVYMPHVHKDFIYSIQLYVLVYIILLNLVFCYRLNVIISPNKDYVGFCGQVYLWAGASFPKDEGSELNALLSLPIGNGMLV